MNRETHILRFYRLANYFFVKKHYRLARAVSVFIRLLFSAEIPASCIIGQGVQLKHGGLGIVIHDNAEIGDGSVIFHNVTIGGREHRGTPKIGENVYIGCGAAVLGNVVVGNGAVIGANAVVIKDVEENTTVVGIPARVKE